MVRINFKDSRGDLVELVVLFQEPFQVHVEASLVCH